ncbi:MAG: hypothetical protein QME62_08710 [Armatimonadota bacterium]|nr:hypothetical protein [Armatimonadota bacterium]
MRNKLLFALATICISVFIAGCGGGGGGEQPGTLLTIGADVYTGGTAGLSSVRADSTLTAPLDAGSLVVAYDFETGKEVARGTLDSTGWCTLKITPGLTVAVVITGTREGKNFRFSTVIPQVPLDSKEYVLTPATSIAAEAIAQKFFKKGEQLDEGTFNKVLEVAAAFVEAHADSDYSLGGGIIGGDSFGAQDSLGDLVADVKDSVPDEIDDKLVLAKNAVQQIKEAGLPLEALVSQEPTDISNIFTDQIANKYHALFERLAKLIVPAVGGDIKYNSEDSVSVFELAMGHAYRVIGNYDGQLVIEDATGGQAGQITITYETSEGIYKLIATKSGSTWTVKQTSSKDSAQEYVVTISGFPENGLGANPSITGTFKLKDSVFTTPLTFNGTLSATGTDPDHYYQWVFDGALATPELSAQGRFQANFVTSLPSGADPNEDSIYSFPTGASMTNSKITLTGGGATIVLSGNISLTTQLVYENEYPQMEPKNFALSGAYSNSKSGLNFSGSITADWANPGAELNEASASLVLQGELLRSGHPTYYADMRFNLANSKVTSQFDLRAGSNTLAGTGTVTLDANGKVGSGSLTLTNQSGVQFAISVNASGVLSGTVKVVGETKANITKEGNLLKITYTDGTFDAFEL